MFRDYKKRLKETPGGSFFVYPYESEKEIKFYSITFSNWSSEEKHWNKVHHTFFLLLLFLIR
jgi:hypothetical protein